MLMAGLYVLEQDMRRLDEHPHALIAQTALVRVHKTDIQAAFFLHFPQGGILRQFVRIDVPSERQPKTEFFVPMQKHSSFVNDEDGSGEVTGHWGII